MAETVGPCGSLPTIDLCTRSGWDHPEAQVRKWQTKAQSIIVDLPLSASKVRPNCVVYLHEGCLDVCMRARWRILRGNIGLNHYIGTCTWWRAPCHAGRRACMRCPNPKRGSEIPCDLTPRVVSDTNQIGMSIRVASQCHSRRQGMSHRRTYGGI